MQFGTLGTVGAVLGMDIPTGPRTARKFDPFPQRVPDPSTPSTKSTKSGDCLIRFALDFGFVSSSVSSLYLLPESIHTMIHTSTRPPGTPLKILGRVRLTFL